MTMWEPFSEPARRAVVRAQEVAQMFAAHYIGTEHLLFALAEGDDPVAAALTHAVDRSALREQLENVSQGSVAEMVFTTGSKRAIELAFENARRLNHSYIGTAHIALGIVGSEPPPLLPGQDIPSLTAALVLVATHDAPGSAPGRGWKRTAGEEQHPIVDAVTSVLGYIPNLGKEGTRVSVTVAVPGEPERTWSWLKVQGP
jgi:Clp amino terminal domain, pathogenicity island component